MSEEYFAQSRTEMLPYIPVSAVKILDVGCGEGIFGKQLILKNNAEVWGIEPDVQSAKKSFQILHKVINDKFNSKLDLPKKYFDCILFNDVLEHMNRPVDALLLAKELLRESNHSCIVCSIPNFRYIKNMYHILINKDFCYTDSGILDTTHLRFFTRKSIIRFFEENGFIVDRIEGINPSKSFFFAVLNTLLLGFIQDMKYLQYAVVIKPKV